MRSNPAIHRRLTTAISHALADRRPVYLFLSIRAIRSAIPEKSLTELLADLVTLRINPVVVSSLAIQQIRSHEFPEGVTILAVDGYRGPTGVPLALEPRSYRRSVLSQACHGRNLVIGFLSGNEASYVEAIGRFDGYVVGVDETNGSYGQRADFILATREEAFRLLIDIAKTLRTGIGVEQTLSIDELGPSE
jgi:hypothetical protein